MTTQLYLAPAGHGKTTYALERIRQVRAAEPLAPVTVILPNQSQVAAFRQRLSAGGGALGVTLSTFYTLYAEVLGWAGKLEPRLPEPVQFRLLRHLITSLVDQGSLPHYAPLRDKPGFVTAVRALLEELKRGRVHRDTFRQAAQTLAGAETRLAELAEIYVAYQDWLYANGWADTEGQGWLAALALERQPDLGRHLRLLLIDGFDEFNPTQLSVLKILAERAGETIITLTGEVKGQGAEERRSRGRERPAWRRFSRALRAVTEALALEPQPLPGASTAFFEPTLAYLEANLFETTPFPPETTAIEKSKIPPEARERNLKSKIAPLVFIETQNRAEEVRAALRWLKARLIRDQMAPAEVALIARDLSPYRPFIEEIGREFELTLHLREGLNLATNPAIAALMSLLALPLTGKEGQGNWARRPLIDVWRSPYFADFGVGPNSRAADQLDLVARQGLVLAGLEQWHEALAQQRYRAAARAARQTGPVEDEEGYRPNHLSETEVIALQNDFEVFVRRISPPPQATLRDYAAFIEDLIGEDPKLNPDQTNPKSKIQNPKSTSLDMVHRARAVSATAPRDIAALRAFKDVLRGLVLAESSLRASHSQARSPVLSKVEGETGLSESETGIPPAPLPPRSPAIIPYAQFYEELHGAVQGTIYYPPPPEPVEGALPVLSVLNARGLSFRAVALLGLAEGDFPQAEREDILLREEDRTALRQAGLTTLEPRLRGDEISLFYQAVTRAREKLLLSRPYLADDGHTWEPSPYWETARRLVDAPVQHLRPEDPLPWSEVASWPELMQAGVLGQGNLTKIEAARRELADTAATEAVRLQRGAAILQARLAAEPQGLYEGDLSGLAGRFAARYGPDHVWSASRLEAYGLCPHHFWLWQDLALEPRQPPEEGFDIFSLGSMYHEILEEVYRQAGSVLTTSGSVEGEQPEREQLLALLPPVAYKVFDEAPHKYGFRPTALWAKQRPELEKIIADTLSALIEATADSTPLAQEQVFGMEDRPPLVVKNEADEFRVRGFIDRLDTLADGRLRLIDYKSGSTPIAARDLSEGRRLQIALYALAARDALGLGDIGDGFYWHIGSAKASSLKLDKFEGGVAGALQTAIDHAFQHIAGVRAGHFPPQPPASGCPGHCPGAKICWRYKGKGY